MSSDDYYDDSDTDDYYNDLIDGAEDSDTDEFDALAAAALDELSNEDTDTTEDEITEESSLPEFVSKNDENEFHNRVITVVKPDERRTSNIMSRFEMTAHTSIRATQIATYDNCMIDHTGLDDPIRMAEIELMLRKSPLTLRRPVGEIRKYNGEIEYFYEFWDPNTMGFSIAFDMSETDWNRKI